MLYSDLIVAGGLTRIKRVRLQRTDQGKLRNENEMMSEQKGSHAAVLKNSSQPEKPIAVHQKFVQTFINREGAELSTHEIMRIRSDKFPDTKPGSILPNDHAEGNKSPCWYAKTEYRIFDRIDRGCYRVRQYRCKRP